MKTVIAIVASALVALAWNTEASIDLEDMGKFQVIKQMNCDDWEIQVQQINWLHEFSLEKWDDLSYDVQREVIEKLYEAKQIKELCDDSNK